MMEEELRLIEHSTAVVSFSDALCGCGEKTSFDLCSEVCHMLHGNKSDGLRLQDVYEHDSMRVVS